MKRFQLFRGPEILWCIQHDLRILESSLEKSYTWNPKHQFFNGCFNWNGSTNLHEQLVFYQTSTKNWLLLGVPGISLAAFQNPGSQWENPHSFAAWDFSEPSCNTEFRHDPIHTCTHYAGYIKIVCNKTNPSKRTPPPPKKKNQNTQKRLKLTCLEHRKKRSLTSQWIALMDGTKAHQKKRGPHIASETP